MKPELAIQILKSMANNSSILLLIREKQAIQAAISALDACRMASSLRPDADENCPICLSTKRECVCADADWPDSI
jgi:hypothetical protein